MPSSKVPEKCVPGYLTPQEKYEFEKYFILLRKTALYLNAKDFDNITVSVDFSSEVIKYPSLVIQGALREVFSDIFGWTIQSFIAKPSGDWVFVMC